MAWLEITIDTAARDTDRVAALLTARGFSDLVIEDQGEFEEFLDQNRQYWDYIDEALQQQLQGLSRIRLYLEAGDEASLARLRGLAREQGLQLTAQPMADTDWEESWKASYPPQEIGSRLIVLPWWLAEDYSGSRLPVILDPGLTFGTGAHPSTQMVMQTMEEAIRPGSRCLDLGSGSGILSIAALRLGAEAATGIDIDPKAEDIARENAAYNGFAAPAFTALTGNVTQDTALMARLSAQSWDVLLVNIVADVIISLAPVLPEFMGAGTQVILSGILDSRLAEVIRALEQAGLTVTGQKEMEDWRCLCAKRSNV